MSPLARGWEPRTAHHQAGDKKQSSLAHQISVLKAYISVLTSTAELGAASPDIGTGVVSAWNQQQNEWHLPGPWVLNRLPGSWWMPEQWYLLGPPTPEPDGWSTAGTGDCSSTVGTGGLLTPSRPGASLSQMGSPEVSLCSVDVLPELRVRLGLLLRLSCPALGRKRQSQMTSSCMADLAKYWKTIHPSKRMKKPSLSDK